jgi:hypothetical protein
MTKFGITRRRFLACAGVAGLGLVCDAGLVEPFRLEIGRHEFKTRAPAPERPLKLLHLSDFHASWAVGLRFIEEAVDLGVQLKPDLICLTGDFITRQYAEFDSYARVLGKLAAAAPVFACLGNHDGGRWSGSQRGYKTTEPVRQLLGQSRIELLSNRSTTIRINGRDVRLTGLPDVWSEDVNLGAAFAPARAGGADLNILLSHNPDTKEFAGNYPWELMLSGHTHGGQVVLPFLGAPWAPVRDKRFLAGMYSWGGRWLHITRGIGNVRGFRFNCPPEVSLITVI